MKSFVEFIWLDFHLLIYDLKFFILIGNILAMILNPFLFSTLECSYIVLVQLLFSLILFIYTITHGHLIEGIISLTFCVLNIDRNRDHSSLLIPLMLWSEWCACTRTNSDSTFVMVLSSLAISSFGFFNKQQFSKRFLCVMASLLILTAFCDNFSEFLGMIMFVLPGVLLYSVLSSAIGDTEANIVSSLAGFYLADAIINRFPENTSSLISDMTLRVTPTYIIGRAMMILMIVQLIGLIIGSRFCYIPKDMYSKSASLVICRNRITILFWSLFFTGFLVLYIVTSIQIGEHIFLWIWNYIKSDSNRQQTLGIWILVIPLLVLSVNYWTTHFRRYVRRKFFHIIAIFCFTPLAITDPCFLGFSLTMATSVTILIELGRYFQVKGFYVVNNFISPYLDSRENINSIVRTHIYLIYGIGFSLMMQHRFILPYRIAEKGFVESAALDIIPGIISLGVVDTFAAICGVILWRSHRRTLGKYLIRGCFTAKANPSVTYKTTTGFLGAAIAGILFWEFLLLILGATWSHPFTVTSFLGVFMAAIAESLIHGIDNLELPITMYVCLNIMSLIHSGLSTIIEIS